MTDFELTPDMLTLGGAFYPKGHAVLMFPNREAAEQVAKAFQLGAKASEPAPRPMYLSSASVLRDIGAVQGDTESPLQSVGTEGQTVRKYVELARQGHCALLVKLDSNEEAERLMQLARANHFSYGQRYHLLAIEDLE